MGNRLTIPVTTLVTPYPPPIAYPATRLLHRLLTRPGGQILLGHQDTLAYGVGWRAESSDWNSDLQLTCGRYPAVFGWDLGWLGNAPHNLDGVPFDRMLTWMREVHRRGGINTVSWHAEIPGSRRSAWTTGERTVARLLPGGDLHGAYTGQLACVAAFFNQLNNDAGGAVPVIFRPFHEHTGGWFWWGRPYTSPAEFRSLWRYTVDYLRGDHRLGNLLMAYSPDVTDGAAGYLESYPGDRWVDIFGLDDYHDLRPGTNSERFLGRLRTVVRIAEARGKPAGLTETGQENVPEPDWWTRRLLKPLLADPVAARISYLHLWRNGGAGHHFGPYPGHASAADFRDFAAHPRIGMLSDRANATEGPALA